jgi:GNAT superfamily N-acetyltransferase
MILIRPMKAEDSQRVAALSEQLGYPVTSDEIRERFSRISKKRDNACMVAVDEKHVVVGWVHVHEIDRLETMLYAEIGGIVVDEAARQQGVGRLLMTAAEAWAREHGYASVRLSSGLHRAEAHQFYEQIGYRNIRTAYRFEKLLNN